VAKTERRIVTKTPGQSIGWLPGDRYYFRPALPIAASKIPVFKLALLTMEYMTMQHNAENEKVLSGGKADDTLIAEIVWNFVKGWDNFRDSKGKVFEYGAAGFKAMRHSTKATLYYKIFELSGITDDEYEGFQILAGIHSGVLAKFDCAKCRRTPGLCAKFGMKAIYEKGQLIGCTPGSGDVVVLENTHDDDNPDDILYFHCPLKFIPNSVLRWYNLYSYYNNYPSAAPKYNEQTQRYINGMNCYNTAMNAYRGK